ncbi:Transposable element Tc1 transposase [Araneus ventricosus]|uniref:Transposable element Tc1 transposase n=1 Tax=Araneus ventricosus TaxID=182803 RepID=A0A4Y2RAI5_ARAVE|nr:Transposable element Tc1 transposase [Araneus ventricosus]GBN72697.1 Transposable element Tc1 transposase [Araneus ventricosus]GBN72729.1 Transposable element Tc1 transposase [Araneus ventricosus]GBN72733.1 Transposable element Tc1 transposase [Araneus ventricosus]
MDEWKRVAWANESRFLIHRVDGRVRVRRLPGEQLFPSYTAGHTQAGGGGIMLWGMFSWAAMGPIVVVEQTMKAANYLNIIEDQLHPYMFVFPTGNGIFQQDNAPCHKARIVLEWFEKHTDEFHLISWAPNLRILIRWSTFGMSWSGNSEFKHHHVRISRFCVTAA